MASKVQTLRSATPGARPAPGSRLPGELYVNTADKVIGVIDPAGNPLDIVSTGGGGAFLPLAGGTLTGPLLLAADPTAVLGAATKQYVDANAGSGGNFLPLTGGTLTGPLHMSGAAGTQRLIYGQTGASFRWQIILGDADAETGANAGSTFVIANFSDAGVYIADVLAIDRSSGVTSLSSVPGQGHIQLFLDGPTVADGAGISGGWNGNARWSVILGDGTAETGSNIGSNFAITATDDNGTTVHPAVTIERASGYLSFLGRGATPATPSTGPYGHASFRLNKAGSGFTNNVIGQINGVNRWVVDFGDESLETGGNVGSDMVFSRCNQAGNVVDQPFMIHRIDGSSRFWGQRVSITNVSGNNRKLAFSSSITGNDSLRWDFGAGSGAESGANAGSNLFLSRYTDAGALIDNPISIVRSTGVCTFSQPIVNGSDARMKSEITPVTDALAIVEQLQGVYYKFKDDVKRQVGLVAQDVAPVLPEVVFKTADDDDKEKENPLLGISYPNIVAVLINAIKELSAKVALLEAGTAT